HCYQSVGKERADYGQHRRVLQVTRLKAPFGLSRKNLGLANHPQIKQMALSPLAFELAALQKTDELAVLADDGERADAVAFHYLASAIELRIGFDKESRRDRPHYVACAREVPTFARQRFQIFQRQHPVQLPVESDGKRDLPMQWQHRIDQITD